MKTKKVALIGSGMSGLHTLLAFEEKLDKNEYSVVCFERMADVGGLWNFTEDVDIDSTDNLPVHSAMYKNLLTNTPRDLVELPFTNFFHENEPSFLPWQRYRDSLCQLAEAYDLRRLIKFRHYIENVTQQDNGFKLQVLNLNTKEEFTEYFDFVVVGTGRFNIPNWPARETNLLKSFNGVYIHSKNFKDPELYKDKRVLLIGSGISVLDIAVLLKKYGAKKIVLNTKPNIMSKNCKLQWDDNFYEIRHPITAVSENTITFANDAKEEFDTIIACTGFLMKYPFLEEKLQPIVKVPFFPHLYDAIVSIDFPNLLFVGMVNFFLIKLTTYTQGLYIAKLLNNHMIDLPNKENMEKYMLEWYQRIPLNDEVYSILEYHLTTTNYCKIIVVKD